MALLSSALFFKLITKEHFQSHGLNPDQDRSSVDHALVISCFAKVINR